MFQVTSASAAQAAVVKAFFERHQVDFAGSRSSVVVKQSAAMTRETFELSAVRDGTNIDVEIAATDDHAVRWALNALRTWWRVGADGPLVLLDQPAFRWRGVIEGFYGTPWSTEQRLRGVEYFADFGMNLFLVAPKDAKWQRFEWRKPLSEGFVAELAELIARGQSHGVDVSACVSPGLSVTYSDDSDVAAVVAKFEQLRAVGARHFGLLLDDIPDTLTQPDDIARYSNIAAAHADFANRVREQLVARDPLSHVILCPMHYAGRGIEPYLQVMGDQLHPQIELMWTGREICSSYLDISDAVVFDRTTRRPPFYWDNYPVNDGSMFVRLHIAPFEGRERGLERFSAGLLANPMELFDASLLPLGTVGAYLWSTEKYDPWQAWDSTLADLVPVESDRLALREFFRNTLGMTGHWAPAANAIIGACGDAWRAGRPADAAAAARAGASTIRTTLEVINHDEFCAPLLRADVADWLAKYALGAGWLETMAEVLDTCEVTDSGQLQAPAPGREKLIALKASLHDSPKKMFSDGFELMFSELAAEIDFI